MSELPDGPSTDISADFYGPLSSNSYLLVIVDDNSRHPVVKKVLSTSAKLVILHSMFGVPCVIKMDNGPPWNGHDIAKYSEYLEFKQRKIARLHPRVMQKQKGSCLLFEKPIPTATLLFSHNIGTNFLISANVKDKKLGW